MTTQRFEIVGDMLAEWVDKCTCGSGGDFPHESGCGLEPVIPLAKLLTPPRVFFPGETVPIGTFIVSKYGSAIRVDEHMVQQSHGVGGAVVGAVFVETFRPSAEEWQAIVDRARAEREGR
ncbi:hypothetical protein [Amycolatopsis sp. NPDC059657]|uniref:hypothetical protein n=1 Tax=Amycolatopsis sp. NPDC059657 TaxID=3346899 RepID=UPI0036712835